ncbi:type VII secretion system-associated protein [Streptomyces mirabilis]|uniref:type VII secretion system-associated protein n=1 Tax=Streptomyces mirabilis TaxID=68239 RepID=UPI00331F8D85
MADDLTKLDAPALRAFIDGDLTQFLDDIVAMRQPGQTPAAMYDLAAQPHPLSIGQLDADGDTGGKNVTANLIKAAGAIDTVLNKHETAFQDIKSELDNVITTMLKTRGDNLAKVDSQKFLTAISGYDSDIGGSGGTTPSDTTTP